MWRHDDIGIIEGVIVCVDWLLVRDWYEFWLLLLLFIFHQVNGWMFKEVNEVMSFPFKVVWEFMEIEVLDSYVLEGTTSCDYVPGGFFLLFAVSA